VGEHLGSLVVVVHSKRGHTLALNPAPLLSRPFGAGIQAGEFSFQCVDTPVHDLVNVVFGDSADMPAFQVRQDELVGLAGATAVASAEAEHEIYDVPRILAPFRCRVFNGFRAFPVDEAGMCDLITA
jgi:hypothetical protein